MTMKYGEILTKIIENLNEEFYGDYDIYSVKFVENEQYDVYVNLTSGRSTFGAYYKIKNGNVYPDALIEE